MLNQQFTVKLPVVFFYILNFFLGPTFQRVTTALTFLGADAAGGQLLLPVSKAVGP